MSLYAIRHRAPAGRPCTTCKVVAESRQRASRRDRRCGFAAVEETVPELAADIVDLGIMLAGSGALRRNLDRVLRHTSRLPVSIAENPLECVVLCAMRSLVVKAQRLS